MNFTLCDIDVNQNQKIYIRPCYKDIYEEIIALVKTEELPPTKWHNFAIIGIPGIGMTHFIPYFISRLLKDTEHQAFFVQTDARFVRYYDSMGGVTRMDSVPIRLKHVPLFAHIGAKAIPFNADYVFIFSSPDPVRYKPYAKVGYRLAIHSHATPLYLTCAVYALVCTCIYCIIGILCPRGVRWS